MTRVFPSAYLRVFRPLDTFHDAERGRWERFILSGGAPPAQRPVYRDEASADEGRIGLLASAEGELADIRLVEGTYYVCPWRTRLRVLTSILSIRESAPADVVDAFFPEGEAKRAARELARLKRKDPHAIPSILQSPWHVPIRWFLLVGEEERHLVPSGPGEFRLYYWTAIAVAKKRAERAMQVLRRSDLAPLTQLIQEMADWLRAFHPSSFVELDYGSVSSLFSWDELDDDHGGRDIQEAIDALAQRGPGGMARAGELYQAVATRWADAMARDSMN